MRIPILIIVLGICSFSVQSQSPAVKDFTINRIDQTVVVEWTIFSGFQCSDVEVQQSVDGKNFSVVHIEFGICGSDTADESYVFFHDNPAVIEKEYYRIKVGFDEYSEVKELINLNLIPFNLYPNPSEGAVNYSVAKDRNAVFDLVVIASDGKIVHEEKELRLASGAIDIHRLSSGVYTLMVVQKGEIKYQRKLFKQ